MSEIVELSGLTFEVRRSTRRRTLSLTVDRGGELVVHAPYETAHDDLVGWARTKRLWVHRKLALKDDAAPKVRNPEYVTGEAFAYLGKRYRLVLVTKQSEALLFDGTRFLLRRDARPADVHFRQWYISSGKEWLTRRVEFLRARTGPSPSRAVVRDLGYRWGSCGRDGALYLNWRVLQLPVGLVDYVVTHELCHLVELSHRREFWLALERALPDWRNRKEDLRRKATEIYWCAPEMTQ
ncbi:MAG: M48 family metallopeptidase [Gammaproteobacteria bacterium]